LEPDLFGYLGDFQDLLIGHFPSQNLLPEFLVPGLYTETHPGGPGFFQPFQLIAILDHHPSGKHKRQADFLLVAVGKLLDQRPVDPADFVVKEDFAERVSRSWMKGRDRFWIIRPSSLIHGQRPGPRISD